MNFKLFVSGVISTALLSACLGSGGGGSTSTATSTTTNVPTTITPGTGATGGAASVTTALTGIQAQLTLLQTMFVVARPAATDAALVGIFHASTMHNGYSKGTLPAALVMPSAEQLSIGVTFSAPVAVTPLDVGAVPNDATHQWFATIPDNGHEIRMLAIYDAASGKWQLAGNLRAFSVYLKPYVRMQTFSTAIPISYGAGTFFSIGGMNNELLAGNSAAAMKAIGIQKIVVSGPGLIGANGLPGSIDWFTTTIPVGATVATPVLNTIQTCNTVAAIPVTTNCLDTTLVIPGQYTFVATGATPTAAPTPLSYTYSEPTSVVFPAVNTLTAAKFPNITLSSPAVLSSGALLTITWLNPANLKPREIWVEGWTAVGRVYSGSMAVRGAAGSGLINYFQLPIFAGVLTNNYIDVVSVDANGLNFIQTKNY